MPDSNTGSQIVLADPKILIGGVELTGGLKKQDERLYFYNAVKTVNAPATLTLTTTDTGVELRYTLTGRNPTSKSPKYTGPIVLRQNAAGDTTTVKVRAFKTNNTNAQSKIIKGVLNVVGGNTTSF